MKPAFADTSYLVAANNKADTLHGLAIEFGAIFDTSIITTEYILIETANFFNVPVARSTFGRMVSRLRSSGIRIIPSSTELFDRGLVLFESRPDKEWSLTDCISFVVMNDLGLAEALTADHHFEQAGFVALLT